MSSLGGAIRRGGRIRRKGRRQRDEERPALPTEPAIFVHELEDGHKCKTRANSVDWALVAPSDGKRCLQPFPTVEIAEVKDGKETGAYFARMYGAHPWTEIAPDISPAPG